MESRHIILFDGICKFCCGGVNFIIQRDQKEVFVFAPVQSDIAVELMRKHHISHLSSDTFVLIKNDICYTRSEAALEITKDLPGFWHVLRIFTVVPVTIRDFIYNLIARNRYAWFGKRQSCLVPSVEIRHRFLA